MLSFKEAVRLAWKKGYTFTGRSSRSEFWWTLIVYVGVLFIGSSLTIRGSILSIVGVVIIAAAFAFFICLMARRFHDRNLSAWFLLILFIPTFGYLIALIICALPGSRGANKYGPDPLQYDGNYNQDSNGSIYDNGSWQNYEQENKQWFDGKDEDAVKEFERKLRGLSDDDDPNKPNFKA